MGSYIIRAFESEDEESVVEKIGYADNACLSLGKRLITKAGGVTIGTQAARHHVNLT